MTLPRDKIQHFRRKLEAKRDELAGHRNPEGIAIERTPDSMDELVLANERDPTVERLNRETFLLRQVAGALERIATGEYGICLECEEPISTKRIAALPWAALCLFSPARKPRTVNRESHPWPFAAVPQRKLPDYLGGWSLSQL